MIEEVQPSPVIDAMPPMNPVNWQAQYAAVYLALHHISCAVKDVLAKLEEEPNPKHRSRILKERMAELRDAANAINMYDTTPPEKLGRDYEGFCAVIASQEHLRKSNANLAAHLRTAEGMLREFAEAVGGGTFEEIVAELKTREAERAKTVEKLAALGPRDFSLRCRPEFDEAPYVLTYSHANNDDVRHFTGKTLDEVLDAAAAWIAGGAK